MEDKGEIVALPLTREESRAAKDAVEQVIAYDIVPAPESDMWVGSVRTGGNHHQPGVCIQPCCVVFRRCDAEVLLCALGVLAPEGGEAYGGEQTDRPEDVPPYPPEVERARESLMGVVREIVKEGA